MLDVQAYLGRVSKRVTFLVKDYTTSAGLTWMVLPRETLIKYVPGPYVRKRVRPWDPLAAFSMAGDHLARLNVCVKMYPDVVEGHVRQEHQEKSRSAEYGTRFNVIDKS
jgi:hypothetical protein